MKRRAEAIGMKRGFDTARPVDPGLRIMAIRQMEDHRRMILAGQAPYESNLISEAWMPIGPAPIPNGQTQFPPTTAVSGRVTAIAIHPANANIAYVGTAQGGLYRTTDGGTNWTPLMDNALSLAIGSVAISPSQPETIYIGTGEPNFSADSYFGVGVYRIDNASTTANLSGPFNQTAAAADIFTGRSIGKIIVHPSDPNTIFVASTSGVGGIFSAGIAAGNRGIYRSTNATTASPTFTQIGVLPSPNNNFSVRDISIDPLDPNIMVANLVASGGGIYRSTNALAATPTFTNVLTFTGGTSDVTAEFAVHHTAGPDATFYAATGFGGGRVYISVNGGATWTQQIDNNFCTGQCFYDIAIAVDPTNANTVYLGGSPTIISAKSTNAAVSFTDNNAGVHVDTHVLTVSPSDPTQVWMGTDGGIYKSTNSGLSWTPLNNSQFSATQFMSIAVHPTDPNFSIGGTQDNGTNFYQPGGTWTRADFGDGGYAQIDQNAPDNTNVRMYHTYFNATTLQGYGTVASTASASDGLWSFRGCQSAGATVNGITCTGTINFYAPLERGPGNPNTIYYGSDRLYRSANTGTTHTVVSQNPIVAGVPISAIGISPQNDDVRMVGLNNGALYGTSTGANPLVDLDPLNTIPNVAIARTIIDPNNQTTAYVTLSAFGQSSVWKTTNLNNNPPTWNAVSTGLPAVPVNAFAVNPLNSNEIFVGSDVGVFSSVNGGTSWFPAGTGLPVVAVFGMAVTAGAKLRIATHGRGMWEISVAGALPVTYRSFNAYEKPQGKVTLEWRTASENNNKGFEIERSIYRDNNTALNFEKTGFVAGNGTSSAEHGYLHIDEPTGGNKFMYRLKQIDYDGRFKYSETRLVTLSGLTTQLYNAYPNPADASSIIKYQLANDSKVDIALYDLTGKRIRSLINTRQEAGIYQVPLKTNDLPAGAYIYRMSADNMQLANRIIIRH
ncbi:MAG: T9SS type A sorting domain-containing protein [Chitinophagaceae bacterium]|nr:T9SS type A sorting domain-containing protein [Chitinophagaceae bacterium]